MSHIARCSEQDAPNLLTSDDLRSNALRRFRADLSNKSTSKKQFTAIDFQKVYGQYKAHDLAER